MLLGEFTPKLDDKNRVIFPAKFRADFSDGMVLTRGQERCIYAFPSREFQQLYDRARQAPVSSKNVRSYLRVLLSGASDEMLDGQNRITIPASLREYAGIERDLAVIGLGTRVEIWDAASWQEYLAAEESSYSDTSEEVIPGLL